MPGPGDQGSGRGPDAALAGWHGFGEYLGRALQAAAAAVT
jgi:hypothetical protein